MIKTPRYFVAVFLLSFTSACLGTVEVDCTEEPTDSACMQACVQDPTRTHCFCFDEPERVECAQTCAEYPNISFCAAVDAGPADGSVDAGPDVPASNCPTACEGDTPICDEDGTMECVQCLTPTDCEGMGVNTMCNDAGSCVQCVDSTQCTEPGASECATEGIMAGSCVGCTVGAEGACAGVEVDGTALNVCDDSSGSGVCVECNAGDESACSATVCNVPEQTCTDDTMPNLGAPCSLCVSDRQCMGEMVCAQETFAGEPTEFRCATLRDDVLDRDCFNISPYVAANNEIATIGGEGVEVCQLATTTCSSLLQYREEDCMTLDAEGDARCGLPEVDDGFCRTIPMTTRNRCTYECTSSDDCRGGFGCDAGQTPAVCRLAAM